MTAQGAIYDPVTETWRATSTVGAPAPRTHHVAVWAGDRMIVWGRTIEEPPGSGEYVVAADGAGFDPSFDAWTPLGMVRPTPVGRAHHAAVWTGDRMLMWGGIGGGAHLGDGWTYAPPVSGAALPGAVADVGASKPDDTTIDLTWTAPAGAVTYSIVRGRNSGCGLGSLGHDSEQVERTNTNPGDCP